MGCTNCGNCGKEGHSYFSGCKCGSTGNNKLNSYNWIAEIERPVGYKEFNIVEVRFKGARKEYFINDKNLKLKHRELVVVEVDKGYDIGEIMLTGILVKSQLRKREIPIESIDKKILRKCTEADQSKYFSARDKEHEILKRARTIALDMKLEMKISDIEYQGDTKKLTFYYTAESRVDFRDLIKIYASEFKTRIEMRQVGFRHEAQRLGGIGSCGRELCSSTWMSELKQVHLSAARKQNLSINMLKLSGVCGKLKCCLNFELDTYTDALKSFPSTKNLVLNTVNGEAYLQKVDILKKLMWFRIENENDWVSLPTTIANDYIHLNEKGEKAPALVDPTEKSDVEDNKKEVLDTEMVSSEDLLASDIDALDKKLKSPSKKSKKRKNKNFKKQRPKSN